MAREKQGSSKFMVCPYPGLAGNMTTDETDRWNPLFANVRYRAGKGSAELHRAACRWHDVSGATAG
jgi:hypothetical protein